WAFAPKRAFRAGHRAARGADQPIPPRLVRFSRRQRYPDKPPSTRESSAFRAGALRARSYRESPFPRRTHPHPLPPSTTHIRKRLEPDPSSHRLATPSRPSLFFPWPRPNGLSLLSVPGGWDWASEAAQARPKLVSRRVRGSERTARRASPTRARARRYLLPS